jgi:hypothetical protein
MDQLLTSLQVPSEQHPFFSLWLILFPMVLVWFGMVAWLFRRLRIYHPTIYKSLGSPTLFRNNAPRHSLALMRFLLSLQWLQYADPLLSIVCGLMILLALVYTALFAMLVVVFFRTVPRH